MYIAQKETVFIANNLPGKDLHSGNWVEFHAPQGPRGERGGAGGNGPQGRSRCFVKGTMVEMADGTTKEITTITPGMETRGGTVEFVLQLSLIHI